MTSILGIPELVNPAFAVIPVVMMLLAGYGTGRLLSLLLKSKPKLLHDMLYGNLIINFIFLSGFVLCGVVTHNATQYFTAFYLLLALLSIYGSSMIILAVINKIRTKISLRKIDIFLASVIAIYMINIAYHGILIYYHPIFTEFDSLYTYLPSSKSILLGNGLFHDFYLGSDVTLRNPPFVTSLNAWLIQEFGYSSLRIFPIYFIIMGSFFVLALVQNLFKDEKRFLGFLAASAFLITPSVLVLSSRFSLQQEIAIVYLIAAVLFILSNLVKKIDLCRGDLIAFLVTLGLLSLTREIGLVFATALFFILPALKFTSGRMLIRLIFTVLAFSPLYILSVSDLRSSGLTYTIIIRLTYVIAANACILYVASKISIQYSLTTLLKQSKYLFILIIPFTFIALNFFMFGGPYPTILFSAEYNNSLKLYNQVFGIASPLNADLYTALSNLPRLDILFISVAMGSIFLFFKLVGVWKIVIGIKKQSQYAVVIILFLLLLMIWGYLLQSGYLTSDIRHVSYFVPLLAAFFVVGIYRGNSAHLKIYYCGIIVLATYYFLYNELYLSVYDGHFGGFFVDPNTNPIISYSGFRLGATVIVGLIIFDVFQDKFLQKLGRLKFRGYTHVIVLTLIGTQVFLLTPVIAMISPLESIDRKPYSDWEDNVFDVITYLNQTSQGNVLSLRAPAISIFTNRTNFDLWNPHTFVGLKSLLNVKDIDGLEREIERRGIKYVVVPNESHRRFIWVNNLMDRTSLIQNMNLDPNFRRVSMGKFDIYQFHPYPDEFNLIGNKDRWNTTNFAKLDQSNNSLNVWVNTSSSRSEFNRIYSYSNITLNPRLSLITFDYSSNSTVGNARFVAEIRNFTNSEVLWNAVLENTGGRISNQTFVLPSNVLSKPIEFRFYIITESPGSHILKIRNASITYA